MINYTTASVDYTTDREATYTPITSEYTGPMTLAGLNSLAVSESVPKSATLRVYRSGVSVSASNADVQTFYTGGTQLQFSSYYGVHEHKYICVVKRGEFNKSLNVSLHNTSGSYLTTNQFTDNDGNTVLLDTRNENFTPYATAIGLYDDTEQLVAYQKFANPIKITRDFDSVFVVKFDV